MTATRTRLLNSALAALALANAAPASAQVTEPSLFGTPAALERNARVGYLRDVPLTQAITDFNNRARENDVGAHQPPLTSEEVIAGIRAWQSPPRLPVAIKTVFQNIAKTSVMPKGSFIRFIPGLIAVNGFDLDVWWIDVQVGLDRYPTDLVDVPQYTYRIRTVYVTSRPSR